MSHVGDTSHSTPDGSTPGSTSRSRAASGSSAVGGGSFAKKLKFNEHGLPIGGGSSKPSSRLGHLTRTHIPVCYTSWRLVRIRYKNQLWTAYKGEFPTVRDSQKNIFMGKACEAWKKFKGKLRANFIGDDVTRWKEKVPTNVKSEDWEMFCDNEAASSQKELRKKNKDIKDNCLRKTTHNTSRDGYARAAEKWEKEHGRRPNRAELWLYTHKKKGVGYASHDKAFADKIEMLLKVFQASGEEETLDSGPIYEVFGKETRGRVRCIGSTISRTAMLDSAFAKEMLQVVNTDNDRWKEAVDKVQKDMEGLKSTLTEFISDFKGGNFTSVGHNVYTPPTTTTTTPTSVTHAPSTSQFLSSSILVSCKILSYNHEIVGYGRKTQQGVIASVHGHSLREREVRIVLDTILVPDYMVYGGKQGGCNTLADVGRGGFMYWNDDFLPPLDDIDEE